LMLRETGGVLLKKVAVTLSKLREGNDITGDLFSTTRLSTSGANDTHGNRNGAQLSGALDTLNKRYGIDTVRLGEIPQTEAGHVGTKIAFSRIPDKEEFWE